MKQFIEIDGKLPNMNEIINASKKHWGVYAQLKKQWVPAIEQLMKATLKPVKYPVFIEFEWHRRDRRTDPDNISAGGRKIILDCLQGAGILENDGWSNVIGFSDKFVQSDIDKVLMTLHIGADKHLEVYEDDKECSKANLQGR